MGDKLNYHTDIDESEPYNYSKFTIIITNYVNSPLIKGVDLFVDYRVYVEH